MPLRFNCGYAIKIYGSKEKAMEGMCLIHYCKKEVYCEDDWRKIENNDDCYFSDYNIARDDKDLVSIVRKLGKKANGKCAKLKIIKIPDNVEWEICEYDGAEHIAEKHKTWY